MKEFGTGNHNFCRNPKSEKTTIWCYTNDLETEWEFCDPIVLPTFISSNDFTENIKKRLPQKKEYGLNQK